MNRKELAASLKELGIKRGSVVMLHSSYLSLGPIEGGPDAVVDAFLDVLGPKGTLMVPVFGALGVLTDVVKHRKDAVISPCTKGTVAAIGAKAKELVKDHGKSSTVHGEGTPFTKLRDLDGYICLLGVDEDRNTTLHSIEALLELPYLSDTTGTYTDNGKQKTKTWKYYPGPHRNFIGIETYLRHENLITIGRIGNSQVRLMKAKDLFDICLELGEHDPAFVLCDNPACADCVKQRAAIYTARMAQESFKLSASSRLAGRYVPEMIEHLQAVGIKYVELDYIQGKACGKMSAEKLKKVVDEFTENGIGISALRIFYIPTVYVPIIKLAKEAGISRIILPLGVNSQEALKDAIAHKVEVEFVNNGQEAKEAAAELKAINDALNANASAVFNPPAFVRAGEFPFLTSYRSGRYIKTIGQLDMADATWDGVATRFAGGNGEVKELLSILRCGNFAGWVTLGGGAAFPGSLADAANDFAQLIENM